MKRFQFPVEKVRLWRAQQAQMEELKLQQLHAELHRFITQQQDLQNEASRAEVAVKQGGPIAADELARLDDFKQYVRACTSAYVVLSGFRALSTHFQVVDKEKLSEREESNPCRMRSRVRRRNQEKE